MLDLKKPYLMTREEWNLEKEKTKIRHGQTNFTRNSKNEEATRISRLEFLLFGIGEWIYKKALKGDEWALDCLDYGIYDRYDTIIKKAKEEGFIN